MTNTTYPEDPEGYLEGLLNGDVSIFDLIMGSYIESTGQAAFFLMIAGTSAVALFSWSRSLNLTVTWLTLLGGFFVVLLPPAAATIAAVATTALLAVAFYSVYRRNVGRR
jgi:hypothetical protein